MAKNVDFSPRSVLVRLRRMKPLLTLVATAAVTCLLFYSVNSPPPRYIPPARDPVTWVSMSLCWSKNAEVHMKGKFPYREAAKLSTKLWKNKTEANVLMKIVHEEAEPPDDMKEYVEAMRGEGVEVITEQSRGLDCVLHAQLARMYAYQEDRVIPEDFVLVIDVDAFILDGRVLDPINKEDYRIWIYRYAMTEEKGWTFNMNFIAMRAEDWKFVLDLSDLGVEEANPAKAVKFFNDSLRFKSDTERWGIDQVILSHGILRRGLCSLPLNNPLWTELRLKPRVVEDAAVCYHGHSEDCNKERKEVKGGCTWWHFHPDEGTNALNKKFKEILLGQSQWYRRQLGSNPKQMQNLRSKQLQNLFWTFFDHK